MSDNSRSCFPFLTFPLLTGLFHIALYFSSQFSSAAKVSNVLFCVPNMSLCFSPSQFYSLEITVSAKHLKLSSRLSGKSHYCLLWHCWIALRCVGARANGWEGSWTKCLLAGEPVVDRWCLWENTILPAESHPRKILKRTQTAPLYKHKHMDEGLTRRTQEYAASEWMYGTHQVRVTIVFSRINSFWSKN